MKKNTARILIGILFYAVISFFVSTKVFAVATQGISVDPAFQEISLESEPFISGTVTITNNSESTQTLEFFALDINQTDEKGNITFVDKPQGYEQFRIAEFIEFPQKEVAVEPGQRLAVPFRIINSQDLSPGGHYGSVIAKFVGEKKEGNQQVLPAISSLILLRKTGGEKYQLSLREVSGTRSFVRFKLPTLFELTFENNGNIHTTPYGTVIFTDVFGQPVYKGIINESSSTVLPQTRRVITTNLKKIIFSYPIMLYTMQIEGKSRLGAVPYTWQETFLYISPLFVLIVGAVSIGGWFGYRYLKNKKHAQEKTG